MLNRLLESCLANLQVCTLTLLKNTESFEVFNFIVSIYTEVCHSIQVD
jgi:hypothetical protein